MRISDWSSDVCSSDLRQSNGRATGQRLFSFQMFPEKHKIVLPDFLDTSRGEIIKQEGAIARPDKAAYLKIQMFKNAADFPVLAFGQCHLNPLIASGAAFKIRVDLAVADAFYIDAFDQTLKTGLRSEKNMHERKSLSRKSTAFYSWLIQNTT